MDHKVLKVSFLLWLLLGAQCFVIFSWLFCLCCPLLVQSLILTTENLNPGFCLVFETCSLYVVLSGPELAMQSRLDFNSQSSTCSCLQVLELKVCATTLAPLASSVLIFSSTLSWIFLSSAMAPFFLGEEKSSSCESIVCGKQLTLEFVYDINNQAFESFYSLRLLSVLQAYEVWFETCFPCFVSAASVFSSGCGAQIGTGLEKWMSSTGYIDYY